MVNKKLLLPLLVVVGVLVLYFSGVLGPFSYQYPTGLTITSVDNPNMDSGGGWNTKWWIVDATWGGGERVVGKVTPQDMEDWTGVASDRTFKIDATAYKETVTYAIENPPGSTSDNTIYYFYAQKVGIFDNCPSGTDWDIPVYPTYKICVNKQSQGKRGQFSNPAVKFEGDLSVSNGISTMSKTISSDTPAVVFEDYKGDPLVITNFYGVLFTGDPAPNQDNYVPLWREQSSGQDWHVARKETWNHYANERDILENDLQDFVDFPFESWCTGDCSVIVQNKLNVANNKAYEMFTYYDGISDYSDYEGWVDRTSETQATYLVDLDRKLMQPKLKFEIRADWIGVEQSFGDPRIISLSSQEFGSGEVGKITASVRNDAGSPGIFTFSVSDCYPFTQKYSGLSEMIEVPGYGTGYNVIELNHGTVNEDVCSTCTVTVTDYNAPQNSDTDTVQVCMTSAKICTPGEQWTEGKCIYACNSAGDGKYQVKCCASQDVIEYDEVTRTFDCKGMEPGTCGNGICENDENYINCIEDCGGCDYDGLCEPSKGETKESCPQDCGEPDPIDWLNEWWPVVVAVVILLILILGYMLRRK